MSYSPELAAQIWDTKYRLKDVEGRGLEPDIEATWTRVSAAVAQAERPEDRLIWADRFRAAMSGYRFLPAGRIFAGAGTGKRVTLYSCFVMRDVPDSLPGIFDVLKEAALTLQQGGGIGCDFSSLRPKGARIAGIGEDSSGPLTFMDVWDAMCRTIMSAGARRGAMMGCMACDHPDIEAFISAKRSASRLRNFNLSVLVSDAFMAAVEAGHAWDLKFSGVIYRTVDARTLWNEIMRATYDVSEPGVIFIDRVNREDPLNYCEVIHATNPCGEQPLPPNGACLLSSINLAALVTAPFTTHASLNEYELEQLTRTAIRFMDNVIDVSKFPLPAQEHEAKTKRRIGLGITGLADALIMLGIRYGSDEALEHTGRWLKRISHAAYLSSAQIASEKGSFPAFDRERYLSHPRIAALPAEIKDAIATQGLRNGLLTSIAPTGTISLLAGNVSSGIEPIFNFRYRRRILAADDSERFETVEDFAYRLFRERFGDSAPLPPAFVDARTLTPEDHLRMQAAAQQHVDSAISKTINLAPDIAFDSFKDVFKRAYALGCKGCTTYRESEVRGTVLSADSANP